MLSRIMLFGALLVLFSCKTEKQNNTLKIKSSVRAVKVVNKDTLYFAGSEGKVGKSEDGGKTWQIDSISANGNTLQFRSIEVTNTSVIVGAIGSPTYFLKRQFNNSNWDTVYKETHPKAFYNCIKFWDNNRGIAVGDATDTCMSIVTTIDGGKTWQKKPCDSSLFVAEGEANFAASNTNISTYENHCWIATGGKQARIFYSLDYGATWTNYPTPFTQGNTMTGIYSIDFLNEKIGFAIGGDWENKEHNSANKALTTDGGKTWKVVGDSAYPGYRSCVKFLDETGAKLIAVGSPGISTSNDTGKTWQHISDSGFYAVENLDINFMLLGSNGKVEVTKLDD